MKSAVYIINAELCARFFLDAPTERNYGLYGKSVNGSFYIPAMLVGMPSTRPLTNLQSLYCVMILRRYGILVFSPWFMHLCTRGRRRRRMARRRGGGGERRVSREWASRDNERAADGAGLIISRNT